MELLDDANQIAADEATFDCLGVLPTDLLEDVLLRLAMDKDKDSLTSCMCSSSTWRVFASRLVPTRLVANGRGALHSYPRHAPAIQRLCLGMPSAGSAASFLLANAAAAGPAKLASVTEVDIMASCYSPAVFDALPLACPALSRIHAHADGNNVGKLSVILAGVHSLGPGRIRELRINTDPGRVKRALMAIRAPATTPVAAAILQLTWLTCLELPHVKMEAGPVRALVGGLPALKHLALHSLRSSVAEEARPLAPSALRTLALRYIPSLRHLQWLPREVGVVHCSRYPPFPPSPTPPQLPSGQRRTRRRHGRVMDHHATSYTGADSSGARGRAADRPFALCQVSAHNADLRRCRGPR
jgi:hypothetical protein